MAGAIQSCGTGAFLLRANFSCSPLPLGAGNLSELAIPIEGLYDEVVTGCWGTRVSQGFRSQMEGPGGGATSPGIPLKEVLGVVITSEEAGVP